VPNKEQVKLSPLVRGFCGVTALAGVFLAIVIGVVPGEDLWNFLYPPSAVIVFAIFGYAAITGGSPFSARKHIDSV
jgi:hypothetical protein